MARRDVKGLHRVVSKGREYWYASREPGAPRIRGEYGTPDFWASYDAAVRERHIPEPGKFRALVVFYKASAVYQKTAASTKKQWDRGSIVSRIISACCRSPRSIIRKSV